MEPSLPNMCKFLPLAITKAEGMYACVGAVAEGGGWVRPEPVYLKDIEQAETTYRYFYWSMARLSPSIAVGARVEDRDLLRGGASPQISSAMADAERLPFLIGHADVDVNTAFADERSLGLVEVYAKGFYIKRAIGGRLFIRGRFNDRTGESYDWIIPEIRFGQLVWPHVERGMLLPEFAERLNEIFVRIRVFYAVGLTKPNYRFPGKFRDCHPLIVGIHTHPDYADFLVQKGRG